MHYNRRAFLASGFVLLSLASAFAQSGSGHHGGLYERLQQPGRIDKPEAAAAQHVFDSPAPRAANPGRWMTKAPLPLPRSEMAWATAHAGRLHLIGGYAEQRVDRPYHHVYDPASDSWTAAAPLPTARSGHGAVPYRDKIFVLGGEGTNRVFGQNEAYDPQQDAWEHYAPMPTPRHGLGAVAIGDAIYVVGGGPVMGGGVQSAVHEAFTLG